MPELHEILMSMLPTSGGMSIDDHKARVYEIYSNGEPVPNAYQNSLEDLIAAKEILVSGEQIRRNHLDFPERLLESPVFDFLTSKSGRSLLQIDPERSIFHRTSVGGAPGTGVWSRPDFAAATIRQRKYDPHRYLDLFSFELKNKTGANVAAVHEALAHSRFTHYAYVIHPRRSIPLPDHEAVKQACIQHGIGLITFHLTAQDTTQPRADQFTIETLPTRRSPDPGAVDQFIDDRFPANLQNQLRALGESRP